MILFYWLWLRMAVSELDCLAVRPLLRVRSPGRLSMMSVTLISWTEEMRSELLRVLRSTEL